MPLLNRTGRQATTRSNTWMILAAGKGTRLLPVSRDYPKPMLPILHKPVLECLIGRGIAAGEFRNVNPAHAVKSLMGPFLLMALWRSVFEPLGAEAIDIDGLVSQHIDTFLRGLRP